MDEKSPLEELKTPLPLPMRAPWVFSSLRRRRRRRGTTTTTTTMVVVFETPAVVVVVVWQTRKEGGRRQNPPQRKRTHARHISYTRGTTPKKPCFRPRKRGKKREKERYKTSLFVTRTWYNSAHIIMSTECTEAAFKLTPLAGNGTIGSREYYTAPTGSNTACTKQASCVSLLVFFSRRNPPI